MLLDEGDKGLDGPQLVAKADAVLSEYGRVHAGTPAADIGMIRLGKDKEAERDMERGYLITCHSPDMLTFVSHEHEMQSASQDNMDLDICFYGRRKRERDSETLRAIYRSNAVSHP